MNLTSTDINITAFLLYKGEAQLIGGMVDITTLAWIYRIPLNETK